jgi:hypothetical protein
VRSVSAQRRLIVRIGGHVRLARLTDSAVADAVWETLPVYGASVRTSEGWLAFSLEIELPAPLAVVSLTQPRSYLLYCARARRILMPGANFPARQRHFEILALLEGPFPDTLLDNGPDGIRMSLMHADS